MKTTTQQFMLLFRFEPNFSYQPSEQELAEMHQNWGAYFGQLAQQGTMVSTHQLGFEGAQVHADASVVEGIYIAEKNTLGGNLIVNAPDLKHAIKIAKQSPILKMGGTVEVRSIQPM
jgi:hypothetical protein